jgi:hypothetical protein
MRFRLAQYALREVQMGYWRGARSWGDSRKKLNLSRDCWRSAALFSLLNEVKHGRCTRVRRPSGIHFASTDRLMRRDG